MELLTIERESSRIVHGRNGVVGNDESPLRLSIKQQEMVKSIGLSAHLTQLFDGVHITATNLNTQRALLCGVFGNSMFMEDTSSMIDRLTLTSVRLVSMSGSVDQGPPILDSCRATCSQCTTSYVC
eukprot:5228080-Amphidinium_carterae.2